MPLLVFPLSLLPVRFSPLLSHLSLSFSFSRIARLSPSRMYPLLLLQPSPRYSPSSCAFLPYLAPTLSTFLLPPLQLFTSSTTNVSFYLVAFESLFSLPPTPLHNLLSFFRRMLFSHFRLLSSSYSVPLVIVLSLLLHPTRPAFLSRDLCLYQ